ncbi:hypothetical protein INS49_005381 [Diaporthe citri]|uniref:uncharacterized protein n=1 Tax=Diaporthe citri TaxID=83186 RepID=UPI001C7FCFDA|nr:uncharacterized protein INS49_005381 [Diaporthe citri]KAG6353673.1 hypothetical protein INS49_005381 [Diaporthe citri]
MATPPDPSNRRQPPPPIHEDELPSTEDLELVLSLVPAPTMVSGIAGSATHESQPPDGGVVAWMSVVAAFFSIMNTWGSIISFGAFQSYYVTHLQSTPSEISWIGSIAILLLFSGGVVTGRLTDSGYLHHCTIIGAFLIVFGTFMASLSTKYWQVLLAQGVCTGIGNGSLLTPMMVIVSTYFKKKLPFVLGIGACGSVTGGLIFPSMVRTLLPTIGFGWTMRAIGFIQLGTLIIAVASARTRLEPKRSGPLLDWTAFGDIEFDIV